MWTTTEIVTLVGALSAGAGAVLGVICTKGVDALLRLRKAKQEEIMEDKKYEDSQEGLAFQQATAAYEKLLQNFEARVNTLELALREVNEELKQSRKEHINCIVEQERLRGELKALQVHVDRLWSHDQANKAQIDQTSKEIKKLTEETP